VLILSQNLSNYDFPIPENSVYRINLAWVNSINDLKILLNKHKAHPIFLDLPIGRTKPPNNSYSLENLIDILNNYSNIKYLAVSNVNSTDDLEEIVKLLPNNVIIVPKIESPTGVENVAKIVSFLPSEEKILMLDHDDLFSALIKNKQPSSTFINYINQLVDFCDKNNVTLLRTIGVIFSDKEKRITQYMS
jgi:citrate lyase beta subunit